MCPETLVRLRKYLGVRAEIDEMGEHRIVPIYVAINIDERAEVQRYPRGLANVHCTPSEHESFPSRCKWFNLEG